METCEICNAKLNGNSVCLRCFDIFETALRAQPGLFTPFWEWLEDVITMRIRAFVAAGHLDEAVDARIKEAFDEHQGRYYHNRRPDY